MSAGALQDLEVSSMPDLPDAAVARRTLQLHIALSCPANAAELARRVGRPERAVREDLDAMIAQGTVHLQEGVLRTSGATRLVAEAAPGEVREIHDLVLADVDPATVRPATLIALAESGCREAKLLSHLVRVVNEHPDGASVAVTLASVARSAGLEDDDVRLLRADDASVRGRSELVLRLTEGLVTAGAPSTRKRAAVLAAGAHVQSARLERAGALYRHIGGDELAQDAAWAVMTALGRGDLDAARGWRAAMGDDALTSEAAGLLDFADGLLRSVEEPGSVSLDRLARSLSALGPFGAELVLPDTPAAIGGLFAISRGEPATAEVLLDRALRAGLGGETGRRRHLLVSAWSLMVQGRLHAADRRLESLCSPEELADRDLLFYWGLRAGLARRRGDAQETRAAWREFRDRTLGVSLSLYDVLPLGEMMVVAARLHDAERVAPMVEQVLAVLAGLGQPPSWAAPLHWCGVQAAFQSEDPAALMPHATALATAASRSPYAATLAQAGRIWLDVLRREADLAAVEISVRDLAATGHVWDASRLAGQAALQHPDREGTLTMMQLAREISKGQQQAQATPSRASILTARELEVGRLVLDGQGYRAIGEQLFISPKTVEHHVARIRNRLGATSRGELLEMLHDIVTATDH